MKRISIPIAVLFATLMSGCAMQPWTDADHELVAKRYCGGMQNYDKHWGQCKNRSALMMASGAQVYTIRDYDRDYIGPNNGVIWSRD